MTYLVARIGKPHGLRGEVTVQVHTDQPQERFVPGAVLDTDPPGHGPLTVRSHRLHNGIHLLAFDEAPDRSAAEQLRGARLVLPDGAERAGLTPEQPVPAEGAPAEGDEFYPDQLVGLAVHLTDGTRVGEVRGLVPRPVQDLLEVSLDTGGEALVPFVSALVPTVDLAGGRVLIDPPPGLLELGSEA